MDSGTATQASGGPRWTEYQGLTIDGVFPLERYLGGGSRSGVFLTSAQGGRAAMKLIPADASESPRLLARWQTASELSHPHLLRIFAGGECDLDGLHFAYVVTECSDEDLAQILPERRLTAGETKDMLQAVAGALEYLHARGFAQAAVKPSNVMAVDEELKLSSDSIVASGDPREDMLALGRLLNEAAETPLADPFDEIVRHCLDPDPSARWTAAQVAVRLKGNSESLIAAQKRELSRSPSLKTAAVGVLLIAGLVAIWRERSPSSSTAPPEAPAAAASDASDPEKPVAEAAPSAPPAAPAPAAEAAPKAPPQPRRAEAAPPESKSRGIEQVMPEIPAKALATIHGTVRVNVRAKVDASGKVTDVSPEPNSASKYFMDRILKATRRWKFAPVAATYVVRYQLRREGATASASRVE